MTIPYAFSASLPVVAEPEVLVIGGGPGGFAAAVMAARQGRRVMLVEASAGPGGMAFLAEITPFMRNHLASTALDAPVYVEWNRRMWTLRGLPEADFDPVIVPRTPLSKEVALLAAEELLQEAGVECLYHHTFFDVVMEDGRITAAIFHSKSGLCAVKASVFIDGTGDGDVAFKAGCPFDFGNEEHFGQPMTLCFKMSGVDRSRMPVREELNRLYDEAKAAGEVDCPRENVLWFDAPDANAIHFNTTRVLRKCGFDGRDLSAAEIEGRRQMKQLVAFLQRRVPGFENAHLASMGAQIGVRESRRIRGFAYQTVEDFVGQRKYPDAIARVRYHVDIHNPTGSGTTYIRMPDDAWCELRFPTLVPQGCRNLLMGCRAISVDHALYSSIRIMPIVCSIGQAAGMAAAIALETGANNRGIDGCEVRRRLIATGARL